MPKYLVIVESPGKIKKIQSFLGPDYKVMASVGHCVDLDPKKLSVDIKNNFKPTFSIVTDKKDVIKLIKEAAKKSKVTYLMMDGDREGAAIARHIFDLLPQNAKVKRAIAYAITKNDILSAIESATDMSVDNEMVESQFARRILDRIVGWKTSWITKSNTGGPSAGRVQSVALRLLAEREKEIQSFVPEEYWEIRASLLSPSNEPFEAILDNKIKIKNENGARDIYDKVKVGTPVVKDIESKQVEIKAYPPFVTQSMISSAKNNFGWTNGKTMKIAQELYENSRISYHRSDSYSLDEQSLSDVRECILNYFGNQYLPNKPNYYKNKPSAQAAHTCIHPVDLSLATVDSGDHKKLYELVWKRTLASQSVPSKEEKTKVIVDISKYDFIASGSVMLFAGWKKIYDYIHSEDSVLPKLNKGDVCQWNS